MSSWEYGIQFTATNYVTPAVEEITSGLQQIETYSMNVGAATDQMGTMSYRGFHQLVFGAQMGLFYTSMLATGMIRAESSTIAVEMAQERYNQAVAKYGPASQQATMAMQSLERAQLYYQRATTYSNLMTISMGLQLTSMAANIYQYVLPSLTTLIGTIEGVGIAMKSMLLSIGPIGWLMLGLGAVGVGVAAYELTRPPAVNLPDTINVTTNTNQAIDEYAQRLKRALNQRGSP